MATKIVTVVGGTGNQGAGVASTLSLNPNYQVRATTRRTDSEAANALRAKGIQVIYADVDDLNSLKQAFLGSHVIYGITDFFEPFAKSGPKHALEVEVQQGINIAKAAAATSTLEHYIWSTLPNGGKISNGKYIIPHFEGKNRIDEFIRSDKALLAKTTFLWVTWYHSNFAFPMFTPAFIPTSGKYVQFTNHSPDTPVTTIGDVRANIGPFVKAILAQLEKTRNGSIVQAGILDTTVNELLQLWAKVNGKHAAVVQTDVKTFNELWPTWAEEMGTMMRFWEEYTNDSWSEPGKNVLTRDDLGIDISEFVGLEASFKGMEF
jgi:hypothetical protein